MGEENKTILAPVVSGENRLTDFIPTQQSETKGSPKSVSDLDRKNDSAFALYDKNPYASLSYPLFKAIDAIINSEDSGDINDTRTELTAKMDFFVKQAREKNLDNAQILVARYLLCAYIDEMIGTTYWGKEYNWAKDSLLSFYYQEAYGGEKFFQLLSKLLAFPANHINLLELMYICLSLGFEGKYRIMDRGRIELEAIRDNLYKQIRNARGRKSESLHIQKERTIGKHKTFYRASAALTLLIAVAVLITVNLALSLWLNEGQNEIIQKINAQLEKIEQTGQPTR
jgi:type VI secretion system protein ImpK